MTVTHHDEFFYRMTFGAFLLVFLLACITVPIYLIDRSRQKAEQDRIARCERDGYEWRDDGYHHPHCHYGDGR